MFLSKHGPNIWDLRWNACKTVYTYKYLYGIQNVLLIKIIRYLMSINLYLHAAVQEVLLPFFLPHLHNIGAILWTIWADNPWEKFIMTLKFALWKKWKSSEFWKYVSALTENSVVFWCSFLLNRRLWEFKLCSFCSWFIKNSVRSIGGGSLQVF